MPQLFHLKQHFSTMEVTLQQTRKCMNYFLRTTLDTVTKLYPSTTDCLGLNLTNRIAEAVKNWQTDPTALNKCVGSNPTPKQPFYIPYDRHNPLKTQCNWQTPDSCCERCPLGVTQQSPNLVSGTPTILYLSFVVVMST